VGESPLGGRVWGRKGKKKRKKKRARKEAILVLRGDRRQVCMVEGFLRDGGVEKLCTWWGSLGFWPRFVLPWKRLPEIMTALLQLAVAMRCFTPSERPVLRFWSFRIP